MQSFTSKALVACSLASLMTFSGGCSKKSDRGGFSAATAAPSTSSTPGSTTSSTTGATTSTNLPPVATKRTDAMVTSWKLEEVIQVDGKAGTITNRWATGRGPADVANGLTKTYVANALSQDVTVIDRLAGVSAGTIDVFGKPVTGLSFLNFLDPALKPLVRPTGVAVTPDGRKVYSANLLNVSAIDGVTGLPSKSILGLSPFNLQGLLSNPGQAISSFMASPISGLGMAKVAATNSTAVVTCMLTGKLMRIDTSTDRVVDYVNVGRAPIGVAIAGNKAYVACALAQEVYVVDLATGTVISQIKAGMVPVDVTVNQAEDKIYVANAVSGDISVIDPAVDLVVDTLPAGLSLASMISQMGITLPNGASGQGLTGALSGFLQGFQGGMSNPASFGALISGGSGSGGLLSPSNLINGLLTGFLSYLGVNQTALAGQNLPAIGLMSVSVAHDPSLVLGGNALMGEMTVTEILTKNVSTVSGLTGLGPVDVAGIWRR